MERFSTGLSLSWFGYQAEITEIETPHCMKKEQTPQQNKPESIRDMFDRIAPTYDLLNRLISFGLDVRWRRKAVGNFSGIERGSFLDIAAGSGDVSLELLKRGPGMVAGTDFSLAMLGKFRDKAERSQGGEKITLSACDAVRLPFRDGSFDGTVVAFGIRNFSDRLRALREMHRVLKPGGISVILELTLPPGRLARGLYTLHARFIIPALGRILSGDPHAYSYLPDSIGTFPGREEFLGLMVRAGFTDAEAVLLSLGTATIFSGRKSAVSGPGP